ncbi:MAG: alkaline phosphatase, partial [Planctomycetia bacterium]|nr:alkaline phosphatase [Planctomycetia bacterium]
IAMNENVPDEATMAVGALNFLKKRSEECGNPGFYMILEGGAIDWAAHANQKPRVVEETQMHQKATIAVLRWLKENDLLDETLVLSTADHETGLIWGPLSDRYAFDPLCDEDGDGTPEFRFNSGGHSNSLVPFWIWGANDVLLNGLTIREDPTMAGLYGKDYTRYSDNTDVFRLSARAITDDRAGIRNVIVLIGDGMGFNTLGASQ